MDHKILVFYFIKEQTIQEISKQLSITQHAVKSIINAYLKPIKQDNFLIIESKMNAL